MDSKHIEEEFNLQEAEIKRQQIINILKSEPDARNEEEISMI
jgi:hypothetical protein